MSRQSAGLYCGRPLENWQYPWLLHEAQPTQCTSNSGIINTAGASTSVRGSRLLPPKIYPVRFVFLWDSVLKTCCGSFAARPCTLRSLHLDTLGLQPSLDRSPRPWPYRKQWRNLIRSHIQEITRLTRCHSTGTGKHTVSTKGNFGVLLQILNFHGYVFIIW